MRNTIALFALLFLSSFVSNAQQVKPGISIGHSDKVVSVGFSPDEKYVISTGEDGLVKLWETKTGRLVKDWDPAPERSGSTKYSSGAAFLDGQYIIAATNGKPLQRWEFALKDDNEVAFTDPKLTDQPTIRSFQADAKNRKVLTLNDKNRLITWNTKTPDKPDTEMEAVAEKITSFCFSQDGKKVYAGTVGGNIITWDANKGKLLGSEKRHNGPVLSLEMDAASGSHLALSGTDRTLEIWNTETPNDRTPLANAYSPGTGSVYPIRIAQFSTDDKIGKYIAYGANTMAVVWDVVKKEALPPFIDPQKRDIEGKVYSVCLSADNQKLLVGYDNGTILLWDVAAGKTIQRLEGRPRQIKQINFTADYKTAFIIHEENEDITLWDGKTGDKKILKRHERPMATAAFSPKGHFLLSSSEDGHFLKWDFEKDSVMWQSKLGAGSTIKVMAISPDEKYALTSTHSTSVDLWDLAAMGKPKPIGTHSKAVTSLAFSNDGRFAMSAANDNTVMVFDVKNGWKEKKIGGQKNRFNNPVAFSNDGKFFLSVSCINSVIELWETDNNQPKTFDIKGLTVVCSADGRPSISPDNQHFIVPATGGAYLWDINKEAPMYLNGNIKEVKSVAFAAGGKVAVAGGSEGKMVLWNVADGKPLVAIYQLDESDWVAITPDGLFDASPGALDKVYFVKDLETIDLEQLKKTYYEPDLLPILMGHKIGKLRDVRVLDDLELYPIVSAEVKNDKLYINLTAREGGIGKVSVFINGSEVIENACNDSKNCPPIGLEAFTKHFFANEEEQQNNVVTIFAYNKDGWLKSPPFEVYPFRETVKGKGGPGGGSGLGKKMEKRPEPGMYAILIGTSDYKENNIDLTFPNMDAKAMATSIQNISGPFFKSPTYVKQLTTDMANESEWPSKDNIRAAFQEVAAKANAEDVFFLFLSGHGVTYSDDNTADFYYLTMECSDMNLANASLRKNYCISTDTLTSWIKLIPAKKRVVVLDACHSGLAAKNFFAGKSLTTSQERELELLKDRTGMYVLASSESGQISFETDSLQQGLLTYSLLQGLKKTNGTVDVMELFKYASNFVPTLAAEIDKKQTPVLTAPTKDAISFAIGVVSPATDIPIAKKSDFMAPALFLDKDKMDDHLFLSNLFDVHLKEDKVDGKLGKMILTTTPQMKDAYTVRGLYEVVDGAVILNGKVFHGGVEKAVFNVQAKTSDGPAVWTKKIEDAVNKVL